MSGTTARVIVLPVAFWAAALGIVRVAVIPREHCGPADPAAMRRAAANAGAWLATNQHADGTFTYDWDTATSASTGDYNVVRHAGAVLGLYEIAGREHDQQAFNAAERGTAWMIDRLVQHDNWVALVNPGDPDARLGASALMSLALSERRLMTGDRQYDDVL